jgi:hypothetical protein
MAFDVTTLLARARGMTNVLDTTILSDVEILEAANDAQERMVQAGSEWQAQESQWEFDYLGTDDGKPLPPGYVSLYGVSSRGSAQAPDLALTPLPLVTRQEWIARVTLPDQSRTYPQPAITGPFYYLWAGKLYVVPQPNPSLRLVIDYYGPPPELTLAGPGVSNYFTAQYFRTIKWGMFAILWDFLDEPDRAEFAEAKFAQFLDRAKAVETKRRQSKEPRVRGT